MAILFVDKVCTNCGKPFKLHASKDGKHHTCSDCDTKRSKGMNIPNNPPVKKKAKSKPSPKKGGKE